MIGRTSFQFQVEAALLAYCCHPNSPWLYKVIKEIKVIMSSLHVIDNHSVMIDLACNWDLECSNYFHYRQLDKSFIWCNPGCRLPSHKVNFVQWYSTNWCWCEQCTDWSWERLLHQMCSIMSETKQQDHILKYLQLAPDLICCRCKHWEECHVFCRKENKNGQWTVY